MPQNCPHGDSINNKSSINNKERFKTTDFTQV